MEEIKIQWINYVTKSFQLEDLWINYVTKSFQLEDLRKAIIDDLEAFQRKQRKQILEITNEDVDEVMKIIQKKGAGRVIVRGARGNSAKAKHRTFAEFDFVHRKGIIAMFVFLYIEEVKEGKNFSVQRISNIYYLFNSFPWNGLMYRIYEKEQLKNIEDYLLRREIRESLRKANKCSIDVSDLKEKKVKSANFKNPCLLLVEIIDRGMATKKNKRFLYTPFGKFEYKGIALNASDAFKDLTGARRVPYGKEAMKKIEALLIQASI